ncbi:hypothetical protein FJ251_00850 [bacterium]|nr:hypothetical protein [bacterium]
MTCKRAQALISLFLDDQLTPADQTRLNRHLADCLDCAAYLRDLQAGLGALRAEPLVEPSVNFDWNLRRKLQQAQFESWRYAEDAEGSRFWPRFLLSAAAALLLALGGGYTAYRIAQAPAEPPAPVAVSPRPTALANRELGIPSHPQPFPGAQLEQPGFQTVGGREARPLGGEGRGAIEAAPPLQVVASPRAQMAMDSLASAGRSDSLR